MTPSTVTPNESAPALTMLVNGEERAVAPGTTLGAFLRALDLDPRMVVVERNRVILHDRAAHDGVALVAGDALEIVHFVGGG
ncbi:MAG: sulfur carrier protein ThiS [Gemmatimonadaceae bacterium]